MKAITSFASALALGLVIAALPAMAADPEAPLGKLTGDITPKLFGFDYNDGVGADKTSYLERYRGQKGWGGGTRSGSYMDLDLDLIYRMTEEQHFIVKRWGEGRYRHGGEARWEGEKLGFSADYSFFRRATGGLDYLFSPNQVPGGTDPSYFFPAATNTASGYAANFVDDSNRFLYEVSRFTYGLGLVLKPGVLGEKTRVAINYNGYLRYGRRFQTYVLGGSDIQSTLAGDRSFALQRWRGFSRNVDENMNRLSWSINASPKDVVNLSYTGSTEKFDNRARDYTHRDIGPVASPYIYNPTANALRPLGFIPDSTRTSHNLKLNRTFGATSVSAGYAASKLEQDTFAQPQTQLGYTKGEINVQNAFLNFDAKLTPAAGLQGFVKYGQRDNDSTYPVIGLITAAGNGQTLSARTNSIESTSYGLAAVLRPKGLSSTLTVGWKSEDKSRDLTFHSVGIIPSVSLYRANTETDEVYAKLSSLNYKGVNLRLMTSYAWADRTGLVTEPSKALGLKAALSYATRQGALFSGYCSIKDTENDNNSWTDKAVASPASHTQDIASTVQSAGVTLHYSPAKDANIHVGLDWTQMDASVLFYESSRRRFESTTTFGLRDSVGSLVDNFMFTAGGDRKASDKLKFSGAYSVLASDGHLASGYVASQLSAIDDTLDNILHTVELGADYALDKSRHLRLGYRYDRYRDSAYPLLSGGVHTMMLSLTFRL